MREAAFLKQNEKKWRDFEGLVQSQKGTVPPDEIAELFIEVTDDLSYARTHFPESKSVQYLNGLAGQVHLAILRNKRVKEKGVMHFIQHDLPLTLALNRMKLFWAFSIFAMAVLIGAVSTVSDMDFARLILGDSYVEMTIRNMESGQPLAVYGSGGEVESFLGITVNNIRVSFLAFVAGIFLSIGTGWVIFSNGIMVGSFFAFLFQFGFGREAILTVMIHGTLELSAIVIAGAAGFCLGHSILFPKTLSRMQSLRQGALDGLKIVLGLIPIFIMAGFLEGFVTRHTDMPAAVSLLIIGGSLAFILYYFVVLPMRVLAHEKSQTLPENGTALAQTA